MELRIPTHTGFPGDLDIVLDHVSETLE